MKGALGTQSRFAVDGVGHTLTELRKRAVMFCPYCGRHDRRKLTQEHVIPLAVAGHNELVIRVCVECNSNLGSEVDSLLSRHTFLRFLSTKLGHLANRQEKHRTDILLKDGRCLTGFLYWEDAGAGQAVLRYEPDGVQPDGSRWLGQRHPDAGPQLPTQVQVLKDDMVDMYSFEFVDPANLGLEPAMIKILLGTLYYKHGKALIERNPFDVFRSALRRTTHESIATRWTDSLKDLAVEVRPNREHLVWAGCADGKTFKAGVSLFSRVTMLIEVTGFGCIVRNILARIPTGLPGPGSTSPI